MIKIGQYTFDGPWKLSDVNLIDRAAIYAILCPRNNGTYDLIYVGETSQAETRLANHERAICWSRSCGGPLSVAIYWTPSNRYTADDRRKIEQQIRNQYNPPCNRQ
jgi:hypothetical protein